jgi:hypothetical protein
MKPELRQTGWSVPKDLKCPVCKVVYNSNTGKVYDSEEANKKKSVLELQAEKQKEIDRKFGIKPIHLKEFV